MLQQDPVKVYQFENGPPLLVNGGIAYVYCGPGNDFVNAEHHWTNFIYGEEGDDTLYGSSDGANDRDTDLRGPDTYRFVGGGNAIPKPGSITILELQQDEGIDVLDFSQWPYPVKIDLTSTAVQTVSVDGQGNPILTLQFLAANRIEQVIYPANFPPAITSAAWANPNPVSLPNSTTVAVVASDPDGGPADLVYTWSMVSGPAGSAVGFSPNGTAASDTSAATFSAAGAYSLRVTVFDSPASATSDLEVLVNPQPSSVYVSRIEMSLTVNSSGARANARIEVLTWSIGMPSNRALMSSTLSIATPQRPTSSRERGWSES